MLVVTGRTTLLALALILAAAYSGTLGRTLGAEAEQATDVGQVQQVVASILGVEGVSNDTDRNGDGVVDVRDFQLALEAAQSEAPSPSEREPVELPATTLTPPSKLASTPVAAPLQTFQYSETLVPQSAPAHVFLAEALRPYSLWRTGFCAGAHAPPTGLQVGPGMDAMSPVVNRPQSGQIAYVKIEAGSEHHRLHLGAVEEFKS